MKRTKKSMTLPLSINRYGKSWQNKNQACTFLKNVVDNQNKRYEEWKKSLRNNSVLSSILSLLSFLRYAQVVNPSMTICIVTDSANAQTNPNRKMERSNHLYILDDKMIQVNENTSQPTTKENKKSILSERTIRSSGQTPEKSDGDFPMNLSKNPRIYSVTISHTMCQLLFHSSVWESIYSPWSLHCTIQIEAQICTQKTFHL